MTTTAFTDEQIAKLEELGGNRWTKNGMDRMYFNVQDLGMVIDRYKSGNVHRAELDGEKISNAEANRLMACKFYIDLVSGEACTECNARVDEENLAFLADSLDSILATVEAMAKTEEADELAQALEQDHYYTVHSFVFGYKTAAIERVFDPSIWESDALAWPILAQVDAVLGEMADHQVIDMVGSIAIRLGTVRPWGEDLAEAAAPGVSGTVVEPADLIDDGITMDDFIQDNANVLSRVHIIDPEPGFEEDYVEVACSAIFERDENGFVVGTIYDGMADATMNDFQYIETCSARDCD